VPTSLFSELGVPWHAGTFAGALILVVVLFLTVPAVLAKSAGGAGARAPSAAAAQMAQGDPRDPFDRDEGGSGAGSGTDAEAQAGTGATTSQSGVTSAGSLPLTGSASRLLVGVAAGLLLAGGVALWTTRYRPRHAGYRRGTRADPALLHCRGPGRLAPPAGGRGGVAQR
jgi:LPXTG-motif cell wall-anchored protein